MALLTIKEVSKKTGVTESALRYYNEKEVLQPTVKKKTGRRQWFYDEEDVMKLRKLLLLKYIGVSIEEAGTAIRDEESYEQAVIKRLEEMRRDRGVLEQKIFVAETLAASFGADMIGTDCGISEEEAKALNEIIRHIITK